MEIRSLSDLTEPDDRSLRFGGMGVAVGGRLSGEDAVNHQQRVIASADLDSAVPEQTCRSFERLRSLHTYGVLFYDAFTIVDDLAWVVLEQALRERFVAFYVGAIPLMDKTGCATCLKVIDFNEVAEAFGPKGSHQKGWSLTLRSTGEHMRVPRTLGPLLAWARAEDLLDGQRNRAVELDLFPRMRNRFAHGSGFQIVDPVYSARSIRDLAELINRLWGHRTPGGRLYPAPLARDVLVVGRAVEELGSSSVVMHADQLAGCVEDEKGWTYYVVLGVWVDPDISEVDATYEMTTYPAEILWGPGSREDAVAWLEVESPIGDHVPCLDRIFALRLGHENRAVSLRADPRRLLTVAEQSGQWCLVRADFPSDAVAHAKHRLPPRGARTPGQSCGVCQVEELARGSWAEVVDVADNLFTDH